MLPTRWYLVTDMDITNSINDFFEMLKSYIDLLKGYLEESEIVGLLNYLFLCIPEEVRAIFIVLLLLMLILGVRSAIKG